MTACIYYDEFTDNIEYQFGASYKTTDFNVGTTFSDHHSYRNATDALDGTEYDLYSIELENKAGFTVGDPQTSAFRFFLKKPATVNYIAFGDHNIDTQTSSWILQCTVGSTETTILTSADVSSYANNESHVYPITTPTESHAYTLYFATPTTSAKIRHIMFLNKLDLSYLQTPLAMPNFYTYKSKYNANKHNTYQYKEATANRMHNYFDFNLKQTVPIGSNYFNQYNPSTYFSRPFIFQEDTTSITSPKVYCFLDGGVEAPVKNSNHFYDLNIKAKGRYFK